MNEFRNILAEEYAFRKKLRFLVGDRVQNQDP